MIAAFSSSRGIATAADAPHAEPARDEVAGWLGRYEAGEESLVLFWRDGLRLRHGAVEVPVDGRWHETVATFAVRHRVSWLPERRVLRFEEEHDGGALWPYELRRRQGDVVKVVPRGAQANDEEVRVRTYRRVRRERPMEDER